MNKEFYEIYDMVLALKTPLRYFLKYSWSKQSNKDATELVRKYRL